MVPLMKTAREVVRSPPGLRLASLTAQLAERRARRQRRERAQRSASER